MSKPRTVIANAEATHAEVSRSSAGATGAPPADPVPAEGNPKIFISHGIGDTVLPINPCSRRIVPLLRKAEYAVMYDEFEGGHVIPPEVAQFAVNWFLDRI
jgi:predicted esterase